MGMQKHTATLEDSLAISYKTKNIFLLERPAVGLPAISQRSGKVTPQKNVPKGAYSSFTHNCQNLEATMVSFSRWRDKWTVVLIDKEVILSTSKKWAANPWEDMEES